MPTMTKTKADDASVGDKRKRAASARSTRKSARATAKPDDAIKLLKADHKEVRTLFEKFDQTEDEARKQELARKICHALTVHTQIEEEIFYPAARQADIDEDLLDEATVEHASAKDLIEQISQMTAADPLFDAKVTVLGEYVNHHVEEEESELFPECRESGMDLKAIGEKLAARKAELQQH